MDFRNCASTSFKSSFHLKTPNLFDKVPEYPRSDGRTRVTGRAAVADVDIDLREVYFLILQFLSAGPCQKTFVQLLNELTEHQLLPRRYHAWFSRSGVHNCCENDDGVSLPLAYDKLLHRYPHISKDHLVRLLKQLMLGSSHPSAGIGIGPNASDVPTLLGTGSFSLLSRDKNEKTQVKLLPRYLRWPHTQIDQVHGLHLRAIGGGFTRHHRASAVHAACYAIAKPTIMVQKMQNITRLRGHRNAVYCAIFDRSGRYVITGSDDRLVKIWSMETALCLASCRGHEGDITDLAVSSNNALVASASNDFVIRVWRLPDGYPISILQGHTGAVTAIAFTPRTGAAYQLLSSSDDGTCRIWDARNSQCKPRIYVPKPAEVGSGIAQQNHQILCCAYNANGTVFVTGSSDNFARVWNACKFSADDPDQTYDEIDLLAGHENDVNYVQFSGCAITARSSSVDSQKEDHSLKFKNSWFTHDNIVTCSRDGSAIIWVSRSRRSHGKVGRWTKAYHLKVPPPPLPPQPPRGGPRRRILPTPRGVNMIMWSLDNRFVLAAIMDCRICVWNAADGSLVHCLTGHTESTYVLDVHPFNPRIAMSAGYDGKTIIWDIWEGTPIRVFEIGRGKLVDGKFSSDGTSIVLSDDVGQIYLLNTGQGESHKDAKYDQFFLGDYRPLVRDTLGNVLDQESQLLPYQRNLQDPLCDSSMIPYPEPYQSMYQRRRLGVLGVEWRPSVLRFAVGPDFSLGGDVQMMMPLPDPEAIIDVPEPLDATFWEPENEVMPDDTDSEYDIAEEISGVKEQETSSTSSYGDTDSGAENFDNRQRQKDVLRRSKRKNEKADADVAASGRRIRRKRVEDCNVGFKQHNRSKKSKIGRKASKKKSSRPNLSRPLRVSARNAMSVLSKNPETSYWEDEVASEVDSSDSESQNSLIEVADKPDLNFPTKIEDSSGTALVDEFRTAENPVTLPEPQASAGNRTKLVLKLSIRDSKKPLLPDSVSDNKLLSSSSVPLTEEDQTSGLNDDDSKSRQPEPSNQKPFQSVNKVMIRRKGLLDKTPDRVRSLPAIDLPKMSAGTDIPEGGSCSRDPKTRTDEDDEYRLLENAVAVKKDNSSELKESIKPVVATRIKIKSSNLLKQEKTPVVKLITGSKKSASTSIPKTYEENYGSSEENPSSTSYNDQSPSSDYSDDETDVVRRTRSMELKASTRDPDRRIYKLKLRKGDDSVGTSKTSQNPSRDWMLNLDTSIQSKSTRSRLDTFYERDEGPQETNPSARKIPWLMLSEHEPGYRYIPQLGDHVAYLTQGHREYIETTGERSPLASIKGRLNDVEMCVIESLDYAYFPGSGEGCCKLTLKFIEHSSGLFGKSFKLTLPELLNVPDFLVERAWYNVAISRKWAPGDMCSVWWRNENGEGGSWWEGRIVSESPKSLEFPDSPWERYGVQYKGDPSSQLHSPWELHDPEGRFDPHHIDFDTRNRVLDSFSKLERRKDEGLMQLEKVSHKPDFLNGVPVPLSPDVIRSRLKHNYYRTKDAVKHDINVMMLNARSYFSKNAEILRNLRRTSQQFERAFLTIE
ncbi:hypothetical protein RND81_10G248400 [Saponaria officinalis]|uniref:Bromo domain-containing protein n=1 Tax=Saponaria officinalis TaxID=3572 RepID=A0AAW1I837_SAPOF